MENTSSPLQALAIFDNNTTLISQIEAALFQLFNSKVIEAKDFSIGCDQIVTYVKTLSGDEVIIKAPKKHFEDKNDPDFFPMHRPVSQAWLMKLLEKHNVLSPRLLFLDPEDKFFIETFIHSDNFNNINGSDQDKERVFTELGAATRVMHKIKSSKFGYMVFKRENEGIFNNWLEMFGDYSTNVEEGYRLKRFDKEIKDKLDAIFEEHKDYLRSFNDPRIIHADLAIDNIRVKKGADGEWHLSGIIDFADTLAADPLYDIGALLCKVEGDWETISYFEKGYLEGKRLTFEQKKLVQFYALYYLTWMLTSEDEQRVIRKTKALHNVLDMK